MEFLELAKARYSVRKFSDKPVEQEKIDSLLEAARVAPTAANRQPQHILVIQSSEALSKVKECTGSHFDAPLNFLICYDRDDCWIRAQDGHNSGEVDASIITTHMMMAAADMGLGSTWVMAFDPDRTRELFAVPQNLEPVAFLPVGYPADDATPNPRHTQRLELTETVQYNSF